MSTGPASKELTGSDLLAALEAVEGMDRDAQFSAALKEQQAIHVNFTHGQSNPRDVGRAGFGTLMNHMICKRRGYRRVIVLKANHRIYR